MSPHLLKDANSDPIAERYSAALENALLAQALAGTAGLPDERTKALLSNWVLGTFNASAMALARLGDGRGYIDWEPDGNNGYRLVWYSPIGLACPLARIFPQENGSWAALVVAGVRDQQLEAMAAAEWGVSCLTG